MNIEAAPTLEEERDCPICGEDGSYVRYDGDLVCLNCFHVPTPEDHQSKDKNPWVEWWEHRRDNYSGKYGENRIRMVGGFAGAYFD